MCRNPTKADRPASPLEQIKPFQDGIDHRMGRSESRAKRLIFRVCRSTWNNKLGDALLITSMGQYHSDSSPQPWIRKKSRVLDHSRHPSRQASEPPVTAAHPVQCSLWEAFSPASLLLPLCCLPLLLCSARRHFYVSFGVSAYAPQTCQDRPCPGPNHPPPEGKGVLAVKAQKGEEMGGDGVVSSGHQVSQRAKTSTSFSRRRGRFSTKAIGDTGQKSIHPLISSSPQNWGQ
ncbi:hypothetical protein GWK47_050816 [Chionoecetes opilio]|uniref:Uncharacterized protein n=1 Tax=Chionoecetes opilio TaxID=41210 RepID=A0A8J4Y8P0_CHIOP|nr:hypothetical protein GWK47_050816 [Chionoecetes opilio]